MTIVYIEKGLGLWKAIEDSGESLVQDNVLGWITSNEAVVQDIIDSYPISATIEEKKKEIDEYADELRNKLTGGVSPEQASWTIKREQALKYLQTMNTSDAPDLAEESFHRGVSLDNIVNRVITNSGFLMPMESLISGVAGKHKDAVSALYVGIPSAADFQAVVEYDYKSDVKWNSI